MAEDESGSGRGGELSAAVVVGQADIRDPAVRRLVEPGTLTRLSALELRDRYLSAVWVTGSPVAVAAARIDTAGGFSEIVSLATVAPYKDSGALGRAIAHLRAVVGATGLRVVFEPTGPVADHVAAALSAGGFAPGGPGWRWFEFIPEEVARVRSALRLPSRRTAVTAAALGREQMAFLLARGHRPHPDDLPECSPVLLDPEGHPLAFLIVRRGRPGNLAHWAWVEPGHRRGALLIDLGDRMFELLQRHGRHDPVRFRAREDNRAMGHLLDGSLAVVVRPLHRVRSWRIAAAAGQPGT